MSHVTYATSSSSIGWVLIARARTAVISDVCLGDTETAVVAELQTRYPTSITSASSNGRDRDELSLLVRHIDDPEIICDIASEAHGTDFQRKVWVAIGRISLGETSTYAELASKIGQPASVRAVAQACGANPLAILIPCHRVVKSDGAITGYRWGDSRKQTLLQREKQVKGRRFFDKPASSAFARDEGDIHRVPMSVIRRIVPSELDEAKVQTFMSEMLNGDNFTPVEIIKVRSRSKADPTGPVHNYYFSLGGCHRYEATKRLELDTIRARIIEAPPSQIRVYLGSSSPF